MPGHRPLATPAVVDGRVFVGGGFGSYEFYSFGLVDGRHDWTYRTADDGPTAAAVSEGFVAFNTESCELEVLTVEGVPAWKRWLGLPERVSSVAVSSTSWRARPSGGSRH
ncbi:MAG: hypothetical protein CMJ69_20080 [Planctomycetaceae bacterium]|nr:hypothetical protein [Planctomycetaceae bacterium]